MIGKENFDWLASQKIQLSLQGTAEFRLHIFSAVFEFKANSLMNILS